MSNFNNNTIIPKSCNYNCGTRIYWDNSERAYLEVFTKKRHSCPNRSNSNNVTQTTTQNTVMNKPTNYSKKSYYATQPKPEMSNSFELLTGSIAEIQKKYEILSDIVTEANGKVHGSQFHIIANNNMSLIVYYEVPEGKREEVKSRFNNHFVCC
ncbi:MAG TPA: hypothetical protein VE445_09925 [Nitrososphaeraceae archaeon]|nr:hypothetical protein [Nitrososphaeraceae archaeon]